METYGNGGKGIGRIICPYKVSLKYGQILRLSSGADILGNCHSEEWMSIIGRENHCIPVIHSVGND